MLGPVIVDLRGYTLSSKEKELLQHPLVGGVILFSRNYESPQQLKQLTSEIHSLRSPALLIATDHEGGVVQRFHQGFTTLPPMASLGELYLEDSIAALAQAEHSGYTMASELKINGVDLSFAPVLDLDKGISQVLAGGRAISAQPKIVVEIAKAYIKGMHRAHMAATGKHFPGHGSVEVDSHLGTAVDQRSLSEIMHADLQPFLDLMQHDLQALMPAHVIFPKIDQLPASLSKIWLQDILRQKLKFKGIVISDCLSMQGAAEIVSDPVERATLALEAGCDMILICNNQGSVMTILDNLQLSIEHNLAAHIEKIRHTYTHT